MTNEPTGKIPLWCPESPPILTFDQKVAKMLKAPDVLRSIQKALLAAGHPVDEFGHPRPTA